MDHDENNPEINSIGFTWPEFDRLSDQYTYFRRYDHIYLNEGPVARTSKGGPTGEVVPQEAAKTGHTDLNAEPGNPEPDKKTVPNMEDSINHISYGATVIVNQGVDRRPRDLQPPVVNPLEKSLYGTSEIDNHQSFLLYPQVPAFALDMKQWRM